MRDTLEIRAIGFRRDIVFRVKGRPSRFLEQFPMRSIHLDSTFAPLMRKIALID
jgi:hypothetical protein